MLKPVSRPNPRIIRAYKEDGAFFMEQEAGAIRIIPQDDKIVRVSFSEDKGFNETRDRGITGASGRGGWTLEERDDCFCVCGKSLDVKVGKDAGAIRYEKKDGRAILRENKQGGKAVEGFDSYRAAAGSGARIEEIRTPDGVKRKISDVDRVFDRKLYRTTLSLEFEPDELLFGLGQAEEGLWNLKGTTQYLHQANLKIAIPMLISNRGYGLLMTARSPMIFEDTQYGSYIYAEADDYLDYYFIAGNLSEIVKAYRQLTGKASMLPKWAFGYIQSQERYESAEEILATARMFSKTGFKLGAIVLDWMSWPDGMWGQKSFDESRFPDPKGMIEKLHEEGVRFMISVWPNMTSGCENYEEFEKAGLLLPNSDIYDAFSEEGRRLYWSQAEKGLFRHGVDGWWCDSSEPVTPEWESVNKPPAAKMYGNFVDAAEKIMPIDEANAYGYYHAKAVYEGQRGVTDEKRVVNLTRSGYIGSQKYGTILWSGDTSASWENLKKQITAGLQFVSCGHPYWTLDIGAFFVKKGAQWYWNGEYEEGIEDIRYRELYVRWFQYGAFLPVFRSHGTDVRREPWNFGKAGDPFYEALLYANQLRYMLMPYIYSLAGNAWRMDELIMRPLIYDFPGDEKAGRISSQYMFGPAIMVCPVTEPICGGLKAKDANAARGRMTIYLPGDGTDVWYDLYSDTRYTGGREITIETSLSKIPAFVKGGSIIPMMLDAPEGGEDITLVIHGGADCSFDMYDDAGDGYGYENGEYCVTSIYYDDASREIRLELEGDARFCAKKLESVFIF